MTKHQFVEDAPIVGGLRLTGDGYAPCSARVGRTGIQVYRGFEFGMPERDTIRVYRSEAEVFAPDSMRTLAHRPVCNDHPAEPVTAANWREHSIGAVGDTIQRDGTYLKVDMLLMDGAAIKDVQAGKVELSLGYTAELLLEDGESPDGPYDARMTSLRHNHVALVKKGRAGPECRVNTGDADAPSAARWGAQPITPVDSSKLPAPSDGRVPSTTPTRETKMTLKTITVDGYSVETTDQAEKAIVKLQGAVATATAALDAAQDSHATELAAADAAAVVAAEAMKATHDAAIADLTSAHDTAIAAKDSDLADRNTKLAELEAKVLTDAQVDERVAARLALVGKASAIAKDEDFTGKTDHEIKVAAVAAARGPAFAADKSEAYIAVAFDMLDAPKAGTTGDPVRDALMSRTPANDAAPGTDHGHASRVAALTSAWK